MIQDIHKLIYLYKENHISVVMVIVLASSTEDSGFEARSGQTKDYKIGISCFSIKHAALKRRSKNWFAGNQDNVSESIPGLLFQWASTIKIQLMNWACWSSKKRTSS